MKRKKWIALFMSVIMIFSVFGGLPAFSFAAENGQEELYHVTVKVGPAAADVDFYQCDGFDDKGYDTLGDEIQAEDKGTADGYHIYTFSVPKGTYSFRGTDSAGNSIGGMTFDVPKDVNVDGTDSGDEVEITLRQVDLWAANELDGVPITGDQYTVRVEDADGSLATAGTVYQAEDGTYRYPILLFANSNAELYNMYVAPSDEVTENYDLTEGYSINQAISLGTSVLQKQINCSAALIQRIYAPKGAVVQVFNQQRNFKTVEIEKKSRLKKEDGTYEWIFVIPASNNNLSYRVSMDGKITKAGWLDANNRKLTVEFDEEEDPKQTVPVERSSDEASILLNINDKNCLNMKVGETFKLRAYRAAWQIIHTITDNIMIEPDFHLEHVSGEDVLKIEPVSGGDASDNWARLTAEEEGVGVYKVTYDAIDIANSTIQDREDGRYGAIDPGREGYFVVNAGGNHDTAIDWNIGDWDTEMDTVYFFEDEGVFTFSPKADKEISVQVAHGSEIFQEVKKEEDGSFQVPVKDGNNIVCVTAGDTKEYMILKGGKLTYKIENKTTGKTANNADELKIQQGDEIAISLQGLSMPIPKFSGIYNPGWGNTTKIRYTLNDKDTVTGPGTQYGIVTANTFTFTAAKEGENTLTDGCIPMTMMCNPENPWGQHRTLNDSGVGANFNASSVAGEFSILPDITFQVEKKDGYEPPEEQDPLEFKSFQVYTGTTSQGRYNNLFTGDNRTALLPVADYTVEELAAEAELQVRGVTVNGNSHFKVKFYKLGEENKPIAETEFAGNNGLVKTGFLHKNLNDICVMEMQVVSKDGEESPKYKAYLYKESLDTAGALEFLTGLQVTPKLSGNEKISGENGALTFDTEMTEYQTTVYGTNQITITPTAANSASEITVNGKAVASGSASDVIELAEETTKIPIAIGDITYNVEVTKVGLDQLKASSEKKEYVEGDSFETTGLTVTGVFGEEERTLSGYTVSPETLAADTEKVIIFFGGKSCEIQVTVQTKADKEQEILTAIERAEKDTLETIIVENASYIGLSSSEVRNYQNLSDQDAVNTEIAGKTFASLADLKARFLEVYQAAYEEESLQREVNSYLENWAVKAIVGLADDLEHKLTVDNCYDNNYKYKIETVVVNAYAALSKEARYHVKETKEIVDQVTEHYNALLKEREGLLNLANDSLDAGKSVLEETRLSADGSDLDDSMLWVTEEEAQAFQAEISKFESTITNIDTWYAEVEYSGLSEAAEQFDMEVSSFKKLRKTGAVKVAEIQEKALETLKNAYDESKYDKTDRRYLELLLESAEKEINAAKTSAEVADILAKAIEKIEAVETDSGETQSELEKVKAEALAEINQYTASTDKYRAAEQMKLLTSVISAQNKIYSAEEKEAVQKSLDELEEAVKALKTDADYKIESVSKSAVKLTVKGDSYSSAVLSWNQIPDASGYEIYRSEGGSYVKIKTVSGTSFKNTGLETGKSYSYKVRAYVKADGRSAVSEMSEKQTIRPTLAAPQRVKAKAGKKRAAIRWKKVSGASGYKVYRSAKKNGKYKAVKTIKKQRTVTFTNKKLKKGKTWYYKVRAYRTVKGKKVYSPYSKAVKAKIR